jgi:hypothetical protein
MLDGGRVHRVSLGSVMQQSLCARVEKRGGKKKCYAMYKAVALPNRDPVELIEELGLPRKKLFPLPSR